MNNVHENLENIQQNTQDIGDLKESINQLSQLEFATRAGFISNDGIVVNPTVNQELTSDYLSCNIGDIFNITYQLTEAKQMWLAIAKYDSNKTFISPRIVPINKSSSLETYKYTVDDENTKYIRISYRTFGEENCVKISTSSSVEILSTKTKELTEEFNLVDRLAPIIYGANRENWINFCIKSDAEAYIDIPYDTLIATPNGSTIPVVADPYLRIDISSSVVNTTAIKVYYDYKTLTFRVARYDSTKNDTELLICMVRRNNLKPCVSINGAYILNGKKYNVLLPNRNIVSINHRGLSTYPENTLSAFKASRRRGFECVETDIRFTSDGIAVCLHDDSINRTARNADGSAISSTVNIADITYQQALEYDFGIYKGERFAGEKIPTFEEFCTLCRNIGVKPYIELKMAALTEEQAQALVKIPFKRGLKDVAWISQNISSLTIIKGIDDTADIGIIVSSISSSTIETAQALKTSKNIVFIDAQASYLTDAMVELCIDAKIPLGAWTVNTDFTSVNPYITLFTSDYYQADEMLLTEYAN